MSLASYKARVLSQGKNMAEAISHNTKILQTDLILNSPSRSDVLINMDELNSYPCIVSDIDTFLIRRFLFMPDMKVYIGDYICYDNHIYLAIGQTTDDKFPQLIAQRCNFEFPIKTEEIKNIIDYKPNGQPIYETITIHTIKPCVYTSKNYSISDNSSLSLPEGVVNVLLPFVMGEALPLINQKVQIRNSHYTVTGINEQHVVEFSKGIERGYIEVKLQEVVANK